MPFICIQMKIFKHTFTTSNLVLDKNGDLIEDGKIQETYTFTLVHKGMGLYEELAGEPLLKTLYGLIGSTGAADIDPTTLLNSKFVSNLACASYVKIEKNQFHNNRSTAEEFRRSRAFGQINQDLDFVQKLFQMAIECVNVNNQQSSKKRHDENPKKAR